MKNNRQSFTYVEPLVFFLILGSAALFIGLLLFNKNTNQEAIQQIRRLNNTQLAYYEEYQEFAKTSQQINLNLPHINLPQNSENYDYLMEIEKTSFICGQPLRVDIVYNYALPHHSYSHNLFQKVQLKAYVGAASLRCLDAETISPYTSIICESKKIGNVKPAKPILQDRFLKCGEGTKEVKL